MYACAWHHRNTTKVHIGANERPLKQYIKRRQFGTYVRAAFPSVSGMQDSKQNDKNGPNGTQNVRRPRLKSDAEAQNVAEASDSRHQMFTRTSLRSEASWTVRIAWCEQVNKRRKNRGVSET